MKTKYIFIGVFLLSTLFIIGCKKKSITPSQPTLTTPTPAAYTVPTTYNGFTNVDHIESTTIIGMMSELSTEIAKGTGVAGATSPSPLNAQHLRDLLHNQGSPFTTNTAYNGSGYSIEANCLPSTIIQIESFIDTLVAVSNQTTLASNGVAGLGLSLDATPKRSLLTAEGVNYSQILNKNLMCDLILYQITKRVSDNTLDNTTSVAGKNYTAMEHNWDVAFGFFAVSDSFPTVKTGVKYWGSYSNQIDAGLGCNQVMMDAFLKGRAAISNHDMTTKVAQAAIIVTELDKMTAGGVIQEINEVKGSITAGDQVKIVGQLSECKGFVMSMYSNQNAGRAISDVEITALLALFPVNNWNVTTEDLDNIANYIAGVYGFTAAQLLVL